MILRSGVLIFESAAHEVGQRTRVEAERAEIQHHVAAIENAHHHRFAEAGRDARHAQVQFLALHAQHDAAVLRQAALGDVHARHDLDARNHRGG